MESKGQQVMRAGMPEAVDKVAAARILVAYGSGVGFGLVAALAEMGVRSVRLVGDRLMGAADLEYSSRLSREDVGKPASKVVARFGGAAAPELELESVESWPAGVAEWSSAVSGASLVVACVGGPVFFYDWVRDLNRAAVSARVPLTSVTLPHAGEMQIGPTAFPGKTACYHCYELRLKSNMNALSELETMEKHFAKEREVPAAGIPTPLWDLAATLAARQVLAAVGTPETCKTRGKLMVVDCHSYGTAFHPVLRLPRCEVCTSTFEPAPGR